MKSKEPPGCEGTGPRPGGRWAAGRGQLGPGLRLGSAESTNLGTVAPGQPGLPALLWAACCPLQLRGQALSSLQFSGRSADHFDCPQAPRGWSPHQHPGGLGVPSKLPGKQSGSFKRAKKPNGGPLGGAALHSPARQLGLLRGFSTPEMAGACPVEDRQESSHHAAQLQPESAHRRHRLP